MLPEFSSIVVAMTTEFWPSSLAQAIILPLKETVPIIAPSIPNIATSGPRASAIVIVPVGSCEASALAFSSSTAAMVAAAPPPIPLYMAIICGISVIATRLPLHHA